MQQKHDYFCVLRGISGEDGRTLELVPVGLAYEFIRGQADCDAKTMLAWLVANT